MPSSSRYPATSSAAGPARHVLRVRGVEVEPRRRPGVRQDLLLLDAQAGRLERDRLLHGDQGHELEQVVLDDVAGCSDAVVVSGAGADADVLGHGDLHVVDVVAVPDRLEHAVGEPERQDVLHRLLAEVVVDAEHALAREDIGDDTVQLLRRREIVPERLLDDHPAPALVCRGESVLAELGDHDGKERRRDGQVEGVVAVRALLFVELLHRLGQTLPGSVVVELARDETDAGRQLGPDRLAPGRACAVLGGLLDQVGELLVAEVLAREPDQGKTRGQQSAVGQVVDGRDELLAGEVTGDAEQDEAARTGDSRQAPVVGVAQGVAHARSSRSRSSASTSSTCRRSTGRPWSRSTWASPAAWEAMKSPNVNSRPGTGRSSTGSAVICR